MAGPDEVVWTKSTFSNASQNCVEVAWINGLIAIRDSKQGGRGPVLRFTPGEFDAFLAGAIEGEFSRPPAGD